MPKKTITLNQGTPYDFNIESDTSLHVVSPLNNIKKDSSNSDIYICDNRNKKCKITVESRSNIIVITKDAKTMPVVIDGSNSSTPAAAARAASTAPKAAAEEEEEEEEEEEVAENANTSINDQSIINSSNWKDIDKWVKTYGALHNLKLDNDESKMTVEKQQSEFTKDTIAQTLKIPDSIKTQLPVKIIQTSGNNMDCMIHSFLLGVSLTFRKLNLSDKNNVASYFRRNIFYNILQREFMTLLITDMLKPILLKSGEKALLDTNHLNFLASKYNIGVLVYGLDAHAISRVWGVENRFAENYIIIFNPGNNHFEAVKKGTNYIFPMSELKDTIVNPPDEQTACPFSAGDILQRTDASNLNDPIYVAGSPTWSGETVKQCITLPATKISVDAIIAVNKKINITAYTSTEILPEITSKMYLDNILHDAKNGVYKKVGNFNLKTYIQHYMTQQSNSAAAAAAAAPEAAKSAPQVPPKAPGAAPAAAKPTAPPAPQAAPKPGAAAQANANSCLSINRHKWKEYSCYMDSVMFALFSFPSTFVTKYILNADINAIETKIIQELYLQKMRNIMDEVAHKPDNESEESKRKRLNQFIADYRRGDFVKYDRTERDNVMEKIQKDATKIIEYVKRVKDMLKEINSQLRGKTIDYCISLRSILLRGPFTVLDGRYEYSEIQENATAQRRNLANAISNKRFSEGGMEDADEMLRAIFDTFLIETLNKKFLNGSEIISSPIIEFTPEKLYSQNFIISDLDNNTYNFLNQEDTFIVIKVNRKTATDTSPADFPETLKIKSVGSILHLNHIIVKRGNHYIVYFRCNSGWYLYNDLSDSTIDKVASNFAELKLKKTEPNTHGTLFFYNEIPNTLPK